VTQPVPKLAEEHVNETFNGTGLSGMTHADTVGILVLLALGLLVGIGMIAYGVASGRRRREPIIHYRNDDTYADLRSTDRQYNRIGAAPTSDSGFGANRSAQIIQDPAGYWRTAQAYEAPIGYARVQHRPVRPRPAQLAIAARPTSPVSGYRTDPRNTSLLGLRDELPQAPTPVSPPMYPPMSQEEFASIVPTSPPVPSAHHYRPVSVAPDAYEPIRYAPVVPNFNPLGQSVVPPQAKVSLGRHSEFVAKGTKTQQAARIAMLGDNTMAIPVLDMRDLLLVG
jgi:hypothetical protein